MEDVLLIIKSYLEKKKPVKKFQTGFIFLSVLEYIEGSITNKKRFKLVFLFSEIEKTFSFIRKNTVEESKLKLNKTKTLYDSLDKDLKFYLSLSYLPMSSYYHYCISDFSSAVKDLEIFFENSKIILDDNPKLKTLAIAEQQLNLFRIHFSNDDVHLTNQNALDLIMFALYGHTNELLEESNIQNIEDKYYWKAHILDSIFRRYLYDCNNENNLIRFILLLEKTITFDLSDPFYLGVRLLKEYYNYNDTEVKKFSLLLFKNTKAEILPNIFLYIILYKFGKIISINHNTFYYDYFRIANEFIKNKIINKNNSSYIILLENIKTLKFK